MSWNGSKGRSENIGVRRQIKKPNGMAMFVWFAVLIVLATGALLVWRSDENTPNKPKETERGTASKIASVEPKIGRKPQPRKEPKVEKKVEPEPLPPQRVGEIRDGYRLLPSGRLHRVLGEIVVSGDDDSLLGKVFKTVTDRKVMELVTLEPGEYILPDESVDYFRNFDEQFRESLKDEIVTNPDDTDLVKQLKQSARELREELKERMNRGENLAELMTETRKQLQELSLYREELAKQVRELSKDGELSDKDYKDLIDAANLMLEERGCKKLELPRALREQISIQQTKEGELEE